MMRVLCTVFVGLLVVCLMGGVAVSTEEEKADSASFSGLVYGYGVKLAPPYEFRESEDGKTLYLNGLVYAGPGDKEPPDIQVTEQARAIYALSTEAREESEKASTHDERLTRMAAVYRSSPLVESVRQDSHSLHITWLAYPDMDFAVILTPEDEIPDFDREAFWEKQISRFWRIIGSGGMVVFGEKYHIFCPDSSVPKTLDQIERIRRGVSREDLHTRDTPLRNQRFLDDLYREGESIEGE